MIFKIDPRLHGDDKIVAVIPTKVETSHHVIPAQAGIHFDFKMDPRFHGDDKIVAVIPAQAVIHFDV